jgi:DNA-binding CsgD family transcriptional regulator
VRLSLLLLEKRLRFHAAIRRQVRGQRRRDFATRNPWHHVFRHLPEGGVASVGPFAFSDSYRRSEWFNEWAKPQGYGDSIGCHVVRQQDFSCFVSIRRDVRKGTFTRSQIAVAKTVLPHFGTALKCWAHVERERHVAQSFAQALDTICTAVFIVDEDGRLLRMNSAAEQHLRRGTGLISARGYLKTRHHPSAGVLRDAVRAAALRGSASGSSLTNVINPREDGQHAIVRVLPIVSKSSWDNFAPRGGTVALFVTDADTRQERPVELFASAHSLTARETRVLEIIVEGCGLPEAAKRLGIAVTTARTHLQEVFRKTGTRKQSELIRLFVDTAEI